MHKLALVLSIAFIGLGSKAYAMCPTPPSGPVRAGGFTWYDYTPDFNCWEVSSSVSPSSSCFNSDGFDFGVAFDNLVTYTFTIGPNDPLTGSFSFAATIEFVDPNDSVSNQIQGWAYVVHNGSGIFNSLFSHNGVNGDLSCTQLYGNFHATTGDTVTVAVQVSKVNSNTTIKASGFHLYTWY